MDDPRQKAFKDAAAAASEQAETNRAVAQLKGLVNELTSLRDSFVRSIEELRAHVAELREQGGQVQPQARRQPARKAPTPAPQGHQEQEENEEETRG